MKACTRYSNANACVDIATMVLQSTLDAERKLGNEAAEDFRPVHVRLVCGKASALFMLLELTAHASLLDTVWARSAGNTLRALMRRGWVGETFERRWAIRRWYITAEGYRVAAEVLRDQ